MLGQTGLELTILYLLYAGIVCATMPGSSSSFFGCKPCTMVCSLTQVHLYPDFSWALLTTFSPGTEDPAPSMSAILSSVTPQALGLVVPRSPRACAVPGYRKWLGNQGAEELGLRTLLPT